MTKAVVKRAVAVADLMTLSGELGVAVRVEDGGAVSLVGPSGPVRQIGGTVEEAVRHLRKISGDSQAAVMRRDAR